MSDGPQGKLLTVGPVSGSAAVLSPDSPAVAGAYEYSFVGTREFAGITVRRDYGATFIWVATLLLLLGLGLTFYTPRRRLWGRIIGPEAVFRGLGGRSLAIERELQAVVRQAGRRP
jgi:cytochrome c biogenesis protein ResB